MSSEHQDEILLNEIIEIELEMFNTLQAIEPNMCQERPGTFRCMRRMSHSVWTNRTLSSYLSDLRQAKKDKRNFMTEKYARMNELIQPINNNPLIKIIVDIEYKWMCDLHEKYPNTITMTGSFSTYALCELETYSDQTLDYMYGDIITALKNRVNLAEQRYSYIFTLLGYSSIEEIEKKNTNKELSS